MPANARPVTIGYLTQAIKARLEEHFPDRWVIGEISSFKHAESGHLYFDLKDAESRIPCMMPRGFALRNRFLPKDGQSVFALGAVTVYAPRGQYQFQVKEIQQQGIGEAELAPQQLRDSLRAKGYFAPERKRRFPAYPRCIALVTSSTSAAIRDMLELIRQRWPICRVIVRHSTVQGEAAPMELASRLRELSLLKRRGMAIDVLVLGRGGGASQDLGAFNTECVAEAIYDCLIPVVSAVGHETDVTIADLVADRRAETPSAAITGLMPDTWDVQRELTGLGQRLTEAMLNQVRMRQQKLTVLQERPALRRPLDKLTQLAQRLDDVQQRLNRAATVKHAQQTQALAQLAEQLDALSPLRVLGRGYSLTMRAGTATVLRSATDVQPGELIRTKLADGEVLSRVERAS